jgi:osmotically-inducible protein OsmY
VTLEGTANSQAAKDLAGMMAQNTMGVVSVENNLQISPAADTADADTQRGDSSD